MGSSFKRKEPIYVFTNSLSIIYYNMQKIFSLRHLKFLPILLLLHSPSSTFAVTKSKVNDRLENAGLVAKESLGIHSKIPKLLLDKAECVIVFPSVLKGAVGFGGSYGRGAMTCRTGADFKGPWGAPSMMALEGFSFGFQLGGQATDFVLLVMNERGARSILSSKVKIGGDAAAAAGPIGRDLQANLDLYLRTSILTYSRSRGLFAGVSLEGSTLRPDNKANEAIYGKKLPARSIVLEGAVPAPGSAERLLATLNQHGAKVQAQSSEEGPSSDSGADPTEGPIRRRN